MLAYLACVSAFTLPDGRVGHVLRSESAVSDLIRDRVAEVARVAIAEKGCFSPSPLRILAPAPPSSRSRA